MLDPVAMSADKNGVVSRRSARNRDALAAVAALVLGIVLFRRDWLVLINGGTFFVDEYYDIYFDAYKLMLLGALLTSLISGGNPLFIWLALVLPSLVLRNGLFLWQIGPTNTWPAALIADAFACTVVMVPCFIGRWFNRRIVHKRETSDLK